MNKTVTMNDDDYLTYLQSKVVGLEYEITKMIKNNVYIKCFKKMAPLAEQYDALMEEIESWYTEKEDKSE